MPGYWLVKTEPSTYSFDDLKREGVATWDGVKNPVAMKHLRAMQAGDEVLVYHTGNEKSVIGVAQVVAAGGPPPLKAAPRADRESKPPQSQQLPNSHRLLFFFNDTATTEIYTLSLHDALPI